MKLSAYFTSKTALETERLVLRGLKIEDADDMYEYASISKTAEYLTWEKHPHRAYTVELIRYLQKEYLQSRYYDFAVVLKSNDKMIGTAGFTSYDEKNSVAEAGYVINPLYQNNGYATEALSAILNFAFCELGINRVEARYIKENTASYCVMKKCKMTFEGIMRQRLLNKGKYCDIGVCSILKNEYFSEERENIYIAVNEKSRLPRLFHKN